MKLGMICNRPTREDAAFARDLGLEFIEACANNDNDSVSFVSTYKEKCALLAEYGLSYGSVGRWNSTITLDGKIIEEEYEINKALLDTAIEIGSPTFVCGCNYDENTSKFRNYSAAIEYFGRLTEAARGTGTKIAVCNCDWNNFIIDIPSWEIVLGEIPELMIKFDASHSYRAGRDYLREIADWGDRFAHVHIKGYVRNNGNHISDPPAGLDSLDWGAIFAGLYHHGYDGCLSIEPHSGPWSLGSDLGKAGVRFTADFVRRFMLTK